MVTLDDRSRAATWLVTCRRRVGAFLPSIAQGLEARLVSVLLPGSGVGSCLAGGGGRVLVPGLPGAHRLRRRRGGAPFFRWDGLGWSGRCGQCAEPLPAGEKCPFPRPVRGDLQDPLAGAAGEAGRDMPDPVAERVRGGFAQFTVGAVTRRRVQAARSAAMFAVTTPPVLTCQDFGGRLRRPMALAVRTPRSRRRRAGGARCRRTAGGGCPGHPRSRLRGCSCR
jgi:hypothetical protein